jgi:hypothetical protein
MCSSCRRWLTRGAKTLLLSGSALSSCQRLGRCVLLLAVRMESQPSSPAAATEPLPSAAEPPVRLRMISVRSTQTAEHNKAPRARQALLLLTQALRQRVALSRPRPRRQQSAGPGRHTGGRRQAGVATANAHAEAQLSCAKYHRSGRAQQTVRPGFPRGGWGGPRHWRCLAAR